MKARWLFEVAVTSLGLFVFAACATGSTKTSSGGDGDGGDGWTGGKSSSSSSSGMGGAGGGGGSASGGAGGGASSTSSASSSSGGVCPEMPCRLAPQCGCAAGEMCAIDGSPAGTKACVPAGSVPIGGECSGAACSAGGLCIQTNMSISTCLEYCATDAECTAPGGLCLIKLNNGSSGQIPGVTLCTENCDPATNVGCPVPGTSCKLATEATGLMRDLTRCGLSGAGTQGSFCTTNDNCAATFGCFDTGTTECLKYCKIGGVACPAGTACTPLATLGGTEYGACL